MGCCFETVPLTVWAGWKRDEGLSGEAGFKGGASSMLVWQNDGCMVMGVPLEVALGVGLDAGPVLAVGRYFEKFRYFRVSSGLVGRPGGLSGMPTCSTHVGAWEDPSRGLGTPVRARGGEILADFRRQTTGSGGSWGRYRWYGVG